MKQLITPYLPSKYNIKSTHELNQILHTLKPNNGILASLDENLFTNVPVNETIDIINNIYNNSSLPPLQINPNIFRKILLTCTTEVPLYDHLGNIYIQRDSVSTELVMGLIFSNFYISNLENKISNNIKIWDSVWTPKFDMKHLKKAEGPIGWNIVNITKIR